MKALQECEQIDKIVLSTDSDRISEVALGFGFDKVQVFRRGSEWASDSASTESAMLEYLAAEPYSAETIFMLVQATSPFTNSSHIKEALEKYYTDEMDSLLSVCRSKRFFWNPDGTPLNYDYSSRPRRQDFEGMLMENGAFYISKVSAILESQNRLSGTVGLYEMPAHTALELDEPEDWIIGEELMKAQHK